MKKLFTGIVLALLPLCSNAQNVTYGAGEKCYFIRFEERTFSDHYRATFDIDNEQIGGIDKPALDQKFKNVASISTVVNFMLANGYSMQGEEFKVDKSNRIFVAWFRKNK